MKTKLRFTAAWLIAAVVFVFGGTATATNGYFTHGVGTQSKAMAGTGIGSSADMGPIMSASNPALGVFASDDWEVGLSIFSPRRSYSASASQLQGNFGAFTIGQGSFDSSSEWFPIPFVAKNWSLANERDLTFVFYGRGGMNTDWEDSNASAMFDPTGQGGAPATLPGPFGGGVAGVDLSQAFLSLNYASKVSDRFAWGIGPIIAIQAFEAKGIATFAGFTKTFASSIVAGGGPIPVDNLSGNGHDLSFGWGVIGGIWVGLSDTVSAGLSYQSTMSMDEFSDYSDLFAEAGGFDIPASLKGGVSFVATDGLRVNVDVEHTMYSDVDSVGNPMANIFGCPTTASPQNPNPMDLESCLGGERGAGFAWDDMTTYKLGFEWAASDTYTWRFGYSYGEQPIPSADVLFNILAPGVMEQHFTVGLTRQQPNGGVLNFSLMFAPETSVTGPNLFDPTQTITLEMHQLEFEVSYRFGGSRQ